MSSKLLLTLDYWQFLPFGWTIPDPSGSKRSNAYFISWISSSEMPGLSNYCSLNDLLTRDALELATLGAGFLLPLIVIDYYY